MIETSKLNSPLKVQPQQQLDQVKVGLVGYGYWGPKLARNFSALPEVKLSAICDLREECLKPIRRLYPDTETTYSFEDLLTSDIDAIAIATPVTTHYQLAQAALCAGKHVLIEKPIAASSQEAQQLIELARRQNLVLMVGHTFEYHPAIETIKALIESGELGKIHYINSIRGNFGIFRPDINVIWDLATHDLSIFRYLLNQEPLSISAYGQNCLHPHKGLHDVASLTLDFPEDTLVTLRVSWLEAVKVRRLTVIGSRKTLLYDDTAEQKIVVYHREINGHRNSLINSEVSRTEAQVETIVYPFMWLEPLRAETQHFIDCIFGKTHVKSNGEVGLKIVKMLEATDRSLLNHGGKIYLDFSHSLSF